MRNQLVIILTVITFHVSGQNLADTIPICKNAISLELAGSSCNIVSIHYDRIIKKTLKNFYTIDIGMGYMSRITSTKTNQVFGTSISVDWNNKLYKKNHVSGGIGLAYSDGLFQYGFPDETKESHKVLFASLRLGYKFQKTTKGLFFKLMATPIFRIYEFSDIPNSAPIIFPLIGMGIGYSF